jgi:hypothetical protein
MYHPVPDEAVQDSRAVPGGREHLAGSVQATPVRNGPAATPEVYAGTVDVTSPLFQMPKKVWVYAVGLTTDGNPLS